MNKFYPPNYIGYIPLPNGKPAAGGTLIACRTGTDILAPVYDENGTLIVGSAAPIDSSGCVHILLDPDITYRLKIIPPQGEGPWPTMVYDNVRVAECTIEGMTNPMTAEGDMIVGGVDGEPQALPKGSQGAILLMGATAPDWVAGDEVFVPLSGTKAGFPITGDVYTNGNINSRGAIYVEDNTSVASYLASGFTAGTGSCKVSIQGDENNAHNRSTIVSTNNLLVNAGDTLHLYGQNGIILFSSTLTGLFTSSSSGTKTDAQLITAKAVEDMVDSANPMTAAGDMIVGGTGGAPARLGVGADYQVLTSLNGAVGWAAVPAQTGDHKVMVDAGDGSPGYLFSKLVQGAGILLTNNGTSITISAPGSGMTNPMDGVGQMIMGMASGTPYKLTAPTSNYMFLGVTTMGLGNVPEWKYAGNALNKGLAQTWDGQASGFTKGDIIFGGDALAGAGDITGNTEVSFLHIGTEGYVLKSRSGLPVWEAESGGGGGATMQENFSLLNADNSYAVSGKVKTLYGTKVVSNATATRTKLGFFHKSGTMGYVILGIYDNSGALLAQTAKFSPTSATLEQMCWANTLTSFTMTAGEEYWFVVYFDEDNWQCNIEVVGKTYPTAFDANLCASRYVGDRNDMPATLSGMTADKQLFYMGAS